MEGTEKVYCMPYGGNDCLATAALMKGNSSSDYALMNANNWQNNPFMYLVWMMFANRFAGGFGSDGNVQSAEIMSKLNSISAQLQSNQNTNLMMDAINGNHEALHQLQNALGVDFATLSGAISGVQSAIATVGGQVGMSAQQVINSVLLGNKDLTAALQSCCCENKQLIQRMGYESQIRGLQDTAAIQSSLAGIASGIGSARDYLGSTVERGFSQVGYNAQQHTCDIIRAGDANTQKIIDTLTTHWQAETAQALQDAKFEVSQLKQNQYLVSKLGNGCTI